MRRMAMLMRSASKLIEMRACRVQPVGSLPVQPTRLASLPSRPLRSFVAPLSARLPALQKPVLQHMRPLVSVSAAATAEAPPQEETFQYQAEVDRLMDIIVNSLYSNREVFLRELVSNSSDALDKLRFLSLTSKDAMNGGDELEIRIRADKDAGTIVIEDTGVGMTREELLSSLGTIARSGTAKFAQAMKEAKGDANLIGQFGVGFYSSFLVADRVAVQTKSNDDATQWRWESAAGAHNYTVREDREGPPLARGTRVTLFLKEDAKELADDKRLGGLIKQYSEFIQFPIKLWASSTKTEQVVDEDATEKKRKEAEEAARAKGEEGEVTVEPVKKASTSTEWDWTVQNDNKPLWTRSPKEVTKEEYDAFFKATFKEFLEPAAHSHFNVEGTIEFSALLYVPGMAPFEETNWMKKNRNIRLFVKRVFISDEFDEDLMPRWLGFIKGVIDSSDLPLNVSREILQESQVVRLIRRQLIRRSIDMLKDLAKREPEKKDDKESKEAGKLGSEYDTFWEGFGKYIKLGVLEDQDNRTAIAPLLRFNSSKSENALTSLSEVVARMKPNQKDIFYIAADSFEAAASAPFVEQLNRKGFEVLYLTEPIDEPTVNQLGEFESKKFVDVTREGLDLGEEDDEKKKAEEAAESLKAVTDFMKGALGDKVERVAVSSRLADSPCALVTSKFGWSASQERLMRAQALNDVRAAEYMRGRRILEINPDHPIVQGLRERVTSDEAGARAVTELMYDTALVTSGFTVDNPKDFAQRIYSMLADVASGQSSSGASSAVEAARETVEPEVLDASEEGGSDPWKS